MKEKKTIKKTENSNILFLNQILDMNKIMKQLNEKKFSLDLREKDPVLVPNKEEEEKIEKGKQKRNFDGFQDPDHQIDLLSAEFKKMKISDQFEQKRLINLEKKYLELEMLSQEYEYLKTASSFEDIEYGLNLLLRELPKYIQNFTFNDKLRFLLTFLLETAFTRTDLDELRCRCFKNSPIQLGLDSCESFRIICHEILEELISNDNDVSKKSDIDS